ncbi:GDP-L-fucose synthase family protein [Cupriavidus agavae]|uniref:GDP-L-fucose synthase n=1 Tax=Cupriavidus agavae TaxID=1001822 RepID=A0A4Q7RF82_9BURK|nr:GDP-L-fucose synthase [Cupriavidus agavae]RZT31853.1 GDP-L-fucose synthase [Cupriavidus agavae]
MTDARPRILVAGHRGMVGSALVRALTARGDAEIVVRSHAELDLCDQQQVQAFFASERIDQVYLAAARVGGIHANNSYPAEFIHQNLAIATHVIHAAWQHGVRKLLFLGSSCIYPRLATQPIREEALLTGALEPTNAPYALAKIAGIMLCDSYNRQYGTDYRCAMPTNLYGPGDNYHAENSHVIPGLLRRFHDAAASGASHVSVWGTGRPLREFLHVDDLASACLHMMALPRDAYRQAARHGFLNVGSDDEVSIAVLADLVAHATGYGGTIGFDPSRPDGTPRKRLDCQAIAATGWRPRIPLHDGLQDTYRRAVADGLLPAREPAPAT